MEQRQQRQHQEQHLLKKKRKQFKNVALSSFFAPSWKADNSTILKGKGTESQYKSGGDPGIYRNARIKNLLIGLLVVLIISGIAGGVAGYLITRRTQLNAEIGSSDLAAANSTSTTAISTQTTVGLYTSTIAGTMTQLSL